MMEDFTVYDVIYHTYNSTHTHVTKIVVTIAHLIIAHIFDFFPRQSTSSFCHIFSPFITRWKSTKRSAIEWHMATERFTLQTWQSTKCCLLHKYQPSTWCKPKCRIHEGENNIVREDQGEVLARRRRWNCCSSNNNNKSTKILCLVTTMTSIFCSSINISIRTNAKTMDISI